MGKVTTKEWYKRVNDTWPKEGPALSAEEAIPAARKLYRFAMGESFKGEIRIVSGRRYTWIRRNVLSVNATGKHPYGGWQALVHQISHWAHYKLNPGIKPHNGVHARLEIRMIKEVLKRGWLRGALWKQVIDAPPINPSERLRLLRVKLYVVALKRLETWESKRRRAENALKKLSKLISKLEKQMKQSTENRP